MKAKGLIRVLVIDDSAYSRRTITRVLEGSALVEVVGWARDGEEALRSALDLQPDLITLDLEMPRMDGFTFLRLIMARRPTPVVVISSRRENQDVFKALELGAVDFIAKPSPRATPELASIASELLRKVHAIRQLSMKRLADRIASPVTLEAGPGAAARVVAIGSSTGGPAALLQLFGSFATAPPCAFLVAQHMPEGFTKGFASRLNQLEHFRAIEASGGEELEAGSIFVAPGGRHLELESVGGRIVTRIAPRSGEDRYAPSVDRTFASAAKHFGPDLMAVVLTGMGDDGSRGVETVKAFGGSVIAESEETAVVFGMPERAIQTGKVDGVFALPEIATAIQSGVSAWAGPRTDGERFS